MFLARAQASLEDEGGELCQKPTTVSRRSRPLLPVVGKSLPSSRPTQEKRSVVVALIDEEAKTHHFGAVVSDPSRKLKHIYHLVNSTHRKITIVDVINGKPCCGEVSTGKKELDPGTKRKSRLRCHCVKNMGVSTTQLRY